MLPESRLVRAQDQAQKTSNERNATEKPHIGYAAY
jgi:hypothetical protein